MTSDTGLDVVTGAFSYTGHYIAKLLLASGRRVRSMTRSIPAHPDSRIESATYSFDDSELLAEKLKGATTLYNTYWVRFQRATTTFEQAVTNSEALFSAARIAGVSRIVHISITNPSIDSPLPYFKGKALVERSLVDSGIPCSIVRPTVLFGGRDVLINNIAFLLRYSPVFLIAGDGSYRVRPVHVEDVARICVGCGAAEDQPAVIEAVGPETFTFEEMVQLIRSAISSRSLIVHVPADLVLLSGRIVGLGLRDVVLTSDELAGLMSGLVATDSPTTGRVEFSEWLRGHRSELGRRYASELSRHFATAESSVGAQPT